MINKLKIGFLVAVLSLVGFSYANAANLTFGSDTIVQINGNNYVIASGSSADTVVVNGTSLVATLPNASVFTVSSADGQTLTATDGTTTATETCSVDGVGTVTYTASGSQTLTITTSTDIACEGANVGNGGSHHSSGGGGGSSSSSDDDDDEVSTTVAGCTAGAMFSSTTGQACSSGTTVSCSTGQLFSPTSGAKCTTWTGTTTNTNTTVTVGNGGMGAFGTALVKQGSKGAACLAWQTYFNAHGASLVLDGNCGPKTMAFAKTWQASVGLVADGLLGAKSRAAAGM